MFPTAPLGTRGQGSVHLEYHVWPGCEHMLILQKADVPEPKDEPEGSLWGQQAWEDLALQGWKPVSYWELSL